MDISYILRLVIALALLGGAVLFGSRIIGGFARRVPV